jgi:acetyl-CoA carboxylase carboxyltransferase component
MRPGAGPDRHRLYRVDHDSVKWAHDLWPEELDAIDDPRARRVRYDELVAEQYTRGKAISTAAAFEIDDVIDPADTRTVLIDVLARFTAGA